MSNRTRRWLALAFTPMLAGCALWPEEARQAIEPGQPTASATERFLREQKLALRNAKPEQQDENPATPNTSQWMQAQQLAARFRHAEAAWRIDDIANCRRALHRILADNPRHRDSLVLLAQLELLERRPGAVQTLLRDYCRDNPKDAEAQHMFGLVCESLGDTHTALAHYRKAVESEPDNLSYRVSIEALYHPDRSVLTPRAPKVEASPTETPTLASPQDLLARTESLQARQPIDPPRPAVDTTPLAESPPQAEEENSRTENSWDSPAAPAETRRSVQVVARPRSRVVDDYMNGSTVTDDLLADSRKALKPLTTSMASSGRPRTLEVDITDSVGARPLPPAHSAFDDQMFATTSMLEQRQRSESRVALVQAQIAKPNNDAATQAQATHASASFEHDPQRDYATLSMAVELIRSGKAERGKRLLDDDFRLERSARFYRVYGMAQFELGDWKGAAASLSRSLSLDDSSALSYFLMGASLEQLGHQAQAERFLRHAGQLDPRFANGSPVPDAESASDKP